MRYFERTRKLAYCCFGVSALFVFLTLFRIQQKMAQNPMSSLLFLGMFFFFVLGVALIVVARDAQESFRIMERSK
ncbi:hypothetical protein GCM10012290_01030 [Halolactibacillus alkaliphilus]|uniref:Uncharacterized protein n=1 Tax=Halolactibacillus alkaliphilus TaxID=442899 RepID=A0A511WZ64_9BACI|nr:hypothetical protein [Halolactibacillus alkaliphilus]GEN55572.1 hypothetical protein HAL01_00360 [Halolactibacillus alkaliphilus]GGN63959.1 hypothetical protein GCM10012290_01030 [Halolactibacillus alkaliphilus]SFO62125.1 hypothetical protein SAMN05720591_101131 [Halolactibacillus alkaliphilus]